MPYDPDLVGETRAWIIKSRRDIETAAYELQAPEPFSEEAIFTPRKPWRKC